MSDDGPTELMKATLELERAWRELAMNAWGELEPGLRVVVESLTRLLDDPAGVEGVNG